MHHLSDLEIFTTLLQAMQIPLVFLIANVCIRLSNSRTFRIYGTKDTHVFLPSINSKSFLWLSMAMSCNFLYLLLKIDKKLDWINWDDQIRGRLTMFFDFLTTLLLLLTTKFWYFSFSSRKKRQIFLATLIFASLLVLILNIIKVKNGKYEPGLSLSIYNFTGYLVVSIFLLKDMVVKESLIKQNFVPKLLFAGFLAWALLQPLEKINIVLNLDEEIIQSIGYSVSTISKALILFSLYSYYINIAKDATLKLQEREKIEKRAKQISQEAERKSKDNHNDYLQLLIENLAIEAKADAGNIVIQSMNHTSLHNDERKFSWQMDAHQKISYNAKNFLHASFEKKRDFYTGDYETENENNKVFKSLCSYLLTYEGQNIGTLGLVSTRYNAFDKRIRILIGRVAEGAGEIFLSKKLHNAIAELAPPDDVLSDPSVFLNKMIDLVGEYYDSKMVGLWVRDYSQEDSVRFELRLASSDFSKIGLEISTSIKPPEQIVLRKPITIHETNSNILGPFWGLLSNTPVKSLIFLPLTIEAFTIGFITIFSRRELDTNLCDEDIQFAKIIEDKMSSSYITNRMIVRFSEISQSLINDDLNQVLHKIVESARQILNSDPVVLFQYDSEQNKVLYDLTVFSGKLDDVSKIKEGRPGNFLEWLNNENMDEYFSDEDEKHSLKRPESSFSQREKIRSLAAIVLKADRRKIGFMCFNYRTDQQFTEQKKNRIRTFASLAASAIKNLSNVLIIKEQRKKLQEKADKIQFESEKIYQKMLDMVPAANAASLAEIVRAINHDIRNHLNKINYNLNRIRDDFYQKKNISAASLESVIKTVEKDIKNSTNLIKLFEPNSFKISYEDLYEIIKKVEEQFWGEMQGIKFEVNRIKENLPLLKCSKAEISMIIYNMYSNAKNAIIDKIKKISDSNSESKHSWYIRTTIDHDAAYYIIQIEDNGIGIDNDNFKKVFEAGFTTREEGIGIGLFFVKETIEANYSGNITLKSVVNQGTTFKIRLKQHNK